MAEQKPLVILNGVIQQLTTGDTIPSSAVTSAFKGEWDGEVVSYVVGDIVTYLKDAFVCIDDIAANSPQNNPWADTTHWTRLCNRGSSNSIESAATDAIIAGGTSNSITSAALQANIAGGSGNSIVNSPYSSIIGGLNNEISSVTLAVAMGERAKPPVYGSFAHANGRFSTNGDAQFIRTVLRRQGTAATTYALFADGVTSGRQLFMPQDSCWLFTARIVGLRSDGSQGAGYTIHGVARRDGAATAVIVGTNTVAHTSEDDATWDATVTISGTNTLQVSVTQPAITVNWVAVVDIAAVEV